MCGIAGILQFGNEKDDPAALNRMMDAMTHRGPDDRGHHISQPVALGHLRLSIIDTSPAGHQPMHSADGRFTITYNGELYNFSDLKTQLSQYPFTSQSDTEVLLAAYREWGAECVNRFNGMFAFAIWDDREKSLFLSRDRLGIKPLYLYRDQDRLIFASEIRALLASGYIKKAINEQGLSDYLRYFTVHAPDTILDGIEMMIPGEQLTIDASGRIDRSCWWELQRTPVAQPIPKNYSEICRDIRKLLEAAVQRRMISDVPLGAFLSGGIDSSAIVALMAQQAGATVKTFSVVFEEKEFSEATYSRMIAGQYKTEHCEILLKPEDFLAALPEALEALDHPTGDGINSYVVSKATKNAGITVALSGLGGDELFAGYPGIFGRLRQLKQWGWIWQLPARIRSRIGSYLVKRNPDVAAFKINQLLQKPDASLANSYPITRQSLLDHQIEALINPEFGLRDDPVAATLRSWEPALRKLPFLSRISVADLTFFVQSILLRDTDQVSMASALEVRVPFLDHELVEYVLQVPDQFKKPVTPKKLLVDALDGLLPDAIIHRPKMGFTFPWELWLKNELQSFCTAQLEHLGQRPFMYGLHLDDFWQRFLKGDQSIHWTRIWSLVVLENWLARQQV